ncbi:tetraspanin Pls1 family [Rickenella mellea]|uniref:Tetraspanin Pls1 family n=1 Tax=Rickenella mellea TaxID=50990 RepID=A0A4Y7QK74_9AGAM|nr:tetraspanin Pls1 family [Rickenella mellea]
MPSKKLLGVWAFLDVLLLAAGVLTIVLSIVWKMPDLLRDMVISHADLTTGLILGIALIVTWAISVGAIIQPNHVTIGLVILNWVLILDGVVILIIGSFVWFFTLQERANFHKVFSMQSAATQIAVQDKLKCCGYFNSTDLLQIGGSVCQSQAIADSQTPCVGPITSFADMTLNNIFSSIYGFMAIVLCLFLASLCVINKRMEEERFRKIDEKRGGRGFV